MGEWSSNFGIRNASESAHTFDKFEHLVMSLQARSQSGEPLPLVGSSFSTQILMQFTNHGMQRRTPTAISYGAETTKYSNTRGKLSPSDRHHLEGVHAIRRPTACQSQTVHHLAEQYDNMPHPIIAVCAR